MPIEQITMITAKTETGEEVKFDKATVVSLARVTTESGQQAIILPDTADSQEVNFHVEFDDILDADNPNKKHLYWSGENVPDDAWRTVQMVFFDGTKKVFSHPREAARYLKGLAPIRSPRERNANVVNIAEYRPENGKG